MALRGKYRFKATGLNVDSGYIRLESIYIRHKQFLILKLNVYVDKDKSPISPPIEVKLEYGSDEYNQYFGDFDGTGRGKNIYVQAYRYIKSQPDFLDTIDV